MKNTLLPKQFNIGKNLNLRSHNELGIRSNCGSRWTLALPPGRPKQDQKNALTPVCAGRLGDGSQQEAWAPTQ